MITIRHFTGEGTEKFKEYIQELKTNPSATKPELNIAPFSHEFKPRVEIDETKKFTTRLELADYLFQSFAKAGIKRPSIIGNHGLWTWIAYLLFDQLTPTINERRKIREMARYVCSSDYTDYYRHYIAATYDIFSLHGSQNSGLFLSSPPYIHNDFIEQLASRQAIISSKNLIALSHALYWDSQSLKTKRGATDRNKSGSLRRLLKIIGQFELTYDIYNMTIKGISDLLPTEFNGWKN